MSLPERFKGLVLAAFVALVLLEPGVLVQGEEKTEGARDSVKGENLGHDPFILPGRVGFVKENDAEIAGFILSTEWEEGMSASRVDGIFRNGRNAAAIINHVYVKEGSWVGKEQVVEIKKDKVVLAKKGGERRVLPFKAGKLDIKVTKRVKPKAGGKK